MQRVVVISDHAVLAELLGTALAAETDVEVISVAESVDAVVGDPEVVVLCLTDDTRMVELATVVHGRWADAGVVMVARSGTRVADVVSAVRGSSAGLTTMSASAVAVARERLRSSASRSGATAYPQLSGREREVLQGLSTGASPAEIARTLRISLNTCRGYLRTLMAKLGARSQREVVAFVAKHGLPED
jgi:DNA-binding NarL/FixJ family response regulator